MHFITKTNSETGKKFQVISKKAEEALKSEKALSKELGFKQWRGGYWMAFGGFSSVIFDNPPDKKLWKSVNGNEWMPRLTSKEGKAIAAKLAATPRVGVDELNKCIGFNGAPFKRIGFAQGNKQYFGFKIDENWKVKIPKDCEEVTTTKYNQLFK